MLVGEGGKEGDKDSDRNRQESRGSARGRQLQADCETEVGADGGGTYFSTSHLTFHTLPLPTHLTPFPKLFVTLDTGKMEAVSELTMQRSDSSRPVGGGGGVEERGRDRDRDRDGDSDRDRDRPR